jgi:hypothetical protein
MNQKDMNAFLAEQALLLANNSVSLTQISRSQANNKQSQSQNNSINIPSPTPASLAQQQQQFNSEYSLAASQIGNNGSNAASNLSKYSQLLLVLEEMGKDIRPTYSGSRSSAERLKRTIVHARILVRECLLETERQNNSTSRP